MVLSDTSAEPEFEEWFPEQLILWTGIFWGWNLKEKECTKILNGIPLDRECKKLKIAWMIVDQRYVHVCSNYLLYGSSCSIQLSTFFWLSTRVGIAISFPFLNFSAFLLWWYMLRLSLVSFGQFSAAWLFLNHLSSWIDKVLLLNFIFMDQLRNFILLL